MRQRDEVIHISVQPQARGGQHQPRDGDGDQQHVRHEVEREILQGYCAAIAQTPVNRNRTTGDYHHRGEVERVKCDPGNNASALHDIKRKAKDVSAVAKITFELEVYPTKYEWEGNEG